MNDAKLRATAIGMISIGLWGLLPLLTLFVRELPVFQIAFIAFGLTFLAVLLYWKWQGHSLKERLRLHPLIWALGIGGIFGFHLFYFLALRMAPPVEVVLIENLWPFFVLLLSIRMEREHLHIWQVVGFIAGFTGVVLLTTAGKSVSFSANYLAGYLMALACSLTWAIYSMLRRKYAAFIPSHAIGAYCGAAAICSLVAHLLTENTASITLPQSGILLLIAAGPMGIAFFTWDYSARHGDIRVLGALSYFVPLIAIVTLTLFGFAEINLQTVIAALLILAGTFLCGRNRAAKMAA